MVLYAKKSNYIWCSCREIATKEKLFMESENKDQLLSQKLSSLKEEIKNNKYILHNVRYT